MNPHKSPPEIIISHTLCVYSLKKRTTHNLFSAQLVEHSIPLLHSVKFESSHTFNQKFDFLICCKNVTINPNLLFYSAVRVFCSDVDYDEVWILKNVQECSNPHKGLRLSCFFLLLSYIWYLLIFVIQLVAWEWNVFYRNTILELKYKQQRFKLMTYVYTPSHKIEISKIHSPSVINYLILNFQK